MSKSSSKTSSILKDKSATSSIHSKRSQRVSIDNHTKLSKPHNGTASNDHSRSSLQHQLSQLREENSRLVTQNHQLISNLEDTSHNLLEASSEISSLRDELVKEKPTPAEDQSTLLEAQVKAMQEKLAKGTSAAPSKLEQLMSQEEREKEAWRIKRQSLEKQLDDVQDECRRLKEACSTDRNNGTTSPAASTIHLHKSSSYQSLSTHHPTTTLSHTPGGSQNDPKIKPIVSLTFTPSGPLANSTLLSQSHLSESTSSLSSIKSTQSAREFSTGYSNPRISTHHTLSNPHTSHTSLSNPHTSHISLSNPHTSHPSLSNPHTSHSSLFKRRPYSGSSNSRHLSTKVSDSLERYKSLKSREYQPLSSNRNFESGHPSLRSSSYKYPLRSHSASLLTSKSTDGETVKLKPREVTGSAHNTERQDGSVSFTSGQTSWSSSTSEGVKNGVSPFTSPSTEVERANAKIRQLQKEVTLLEQQLADKTQSAQAHVRELTDLRTELARERSSVTMLKKELRESVANELGRARALHTRQCAELSEQLEKLRVEKVSLEKKAVKSKGELKASLSETTSLSERVYTLQKQLDQERSSYAEATQWLHTEVKDGSDRVSQLEQALEDCRNELTGHVSRVEEATQQHKAEVNQLKQQVEVLSLDLNSAQQQLLKKTELATSLQRELIDTRGELQRGQSSWRQVEAEIRQSLEHSETVRQSLLHQVEHANKELTSYSAKINEQQDKLAQFSKCQSEIERLEGVVMTMEERCHEYESDEKAGREEKQRLLVGIGQLKSKNADLKCKLEASEMKHHIELELREEGDRELVGLRSQVKQLKSEIDSYHSKMAEGEVRVEQREKETEDTITHMQKELAKRAQQVLEMDGLLRSHQADTTARRLQLERSLAQRQADLRTRTQELEEVTIKYSDAQKTIEEFRKKITQLESAGHTQTNTNKRELQTKDTELTTLQVRLKEVESVGVTKRQEVDVLKMELETVRQREHVSREMRTELEGRVEQLAKENDSLREQHLNHVQRLQDTHSALLSSREQQATSHRLQLQQLIEQEQVRQEELSRCRAQVASLSAELAAERRVAEETRQQVALSRTDAARAQAQVSSLQKAFSVNNYESHYYTSLNHSSMVPSPLPPHMTTSSALPTVGMETTPNTSVAMETLTYTDLDSEVEFAQLPKKVTSNLISSKPRKGGIVDV